MAQVAAVFTIAAFVRRPEDIVKDLAPVRDPDDEARRPRPEHKLVWASVDKEPKDVIEQMFQEALRRDPAQTKHWTVLIDGNLTQLALIKPALVVPLGRHALAHFSDEAKISAVHGTEVTERGRTLFPMYHPAAALHTQSLRETLFA